ncbi:MAG: RodZ domain-containing protein [Candidatus Omnitrophota bacterium]
MEPVGARLKKMRLEKGITLEDLQRATKINANVLKDIEGDSFTNLSPVYLKGFLKIYCKYLGVDPGEYISGYKDLQAESFGAALASREIREKPKKSASLLKSACVKLFTFKPSEKLKKLFRSAFFALIIWVVLFYLGKFISSRKRAHLAKKTEVVAVARPQPQREEIKPEVPLSSGIQLVVMARQNCWMSVKVDGKVVFQRVLEKGVDESWQAKKKIELSLGNAGGVELEVNGELFKNLGRRGQVIKNLLITKEGLKIGR